MFVLNVEIQDIRFITTLLLRLGDLRDLTNENKIYLERENGIHFMKRRTINKARKENQQKYHHQQ